MQTTLETKLPRNTPETQGISSTVISSFLKAVEQQGLELHSLMLVRHGNVVAEGWWSPYSSEKVHLLYSLSKSFTATAIGFAIAEGRLSEDDFVTSFFPDDVPETISEHLAAMQVRHILSMATGHREDTLDRAVKINSNNWVKGFLSLAPERAPGSVFTYNNGATFMLSAIIQKLTGMKLIDYLRPRLLEPLGITQARWDENPQGINLGFSGFHVTTETIAKFGQLYLQKGIWQGQRLLSEEWVETATREHIPNISLVEDKTADWEQGYGYQFWRCQHGAYRADGAFGQYCVVMPKQDAVLAITSAVDNMQDVLDLTWTHLLPAMADARLADDSTGQDVLSSQLAKLTIASVKGQMNLPIAKTVSGKPYHFEADTLTKTSELAKPNYGDPIQNVTLHFHENECLLVIKDTKKEHHVQCGYQQWLSGKTTFYGEPTSNIDASGAWTDPSKFTLKIIYIETPHCLTLSFTFDQETLTVKQRWNVSFGPLELPVLTGNQ
jgi:CubicO group peptidase (beta-lactamase class C family)